MGKRGYAGRNVRSLAFYALGNERYTLEILKH